MRRRKPFQKLRGSAPTMLEIQVQDLLSIPMGQLEPMNLMDLMSLAEHETPPRALQSLLRDFTERIAREVSDLPAGKTWDEYLEELSALTGDRVPQGFRDILASEREGRPAGSIDALLETWGAVSPTAFEIGEAPPKVERPAAATKRAAAATKRKASPKKATKKVVNVDPARSQLLSELCLERLSQVSENGLGESVLIAGIRHRAKASYPNVAPFEVSQVLKSLKEKGKVRYSAGR
jgi:hypothetical protein